jgi:tetratricopeptide (TPR) repeat protein
MHVVEQVRNNTSDSTKLQEQAATLGNKTDAASAAERARIEKELAAKAAAVQTLVDQNPDARVNTAATEFSLQTNDTAGALKRSNDAVDLSLKNNDPPDVVADALRMRSMANAAAGDYTKANADAKRVLKMYPDDELADRIEKLTRGHAPLTVKLPRASPPPDIIVHFLDQNRRSPINRPKGYDASLDLTKKADSSVQMGDYERMYQQADAAVQKMPDNPKAYMQRAFAGLMLKKYDQVIKDAGAGLKLKPGSSSLLGLRAAALNETGKPKEALEDASKAIEDNPRDPFAWLQKGLAREKMGENNDEFLGDIKNAADLDPSFEHFYTEALARRQQGGAPSNAMPASPGFFQRWVMPVGAVALSFLVVLAAFYQVFFNRKRRAPVAAAGAEAAEGKLLAGQFRVVREIGRGGMGVVYEAWDTRLERPVALKRLSEDLRNNPDEAQRLLKEAKTVAALRHENIVVIHSAFEEDGQVYCVFEKVEGETLHDFVQSRGRLGAVETANYLAPICSALDYAHGLKIIHRDFKPSNVMLEKGKVKIMDFGIARRMKGGKGVTMTEMVIGTPAYMSPELQFGEVSPESDLYALAVSAYQMLTGRLPFEGQAIVQDKMDGRFAPPSSFVKGAPGIDAFFKKALAADRKERYHSGAEFLHEFKKALA